MASVEVAIPWQSGCEHRERALEWVSGRYCEAGYSPWLVELESFTKSRAVNRAAESAKSDILVVADADCWTDGLADAIEAVQAGASWAVPHRHVHRLAEQGSLDFMAGGEGELLEPPYVGIKGGGIFVVRREVLLDVPWDERYVAWGRQDRSWRNAMTTLHGEPWRGEAALYHCWHPPLPRRGRVISLSDASEALYEQYESARFDVAAMRSLLKGARCK